MTHAQRRRVRVESQAAQSPASIDSLYSRAPTTVHRSSRAAAALLTTFISPSVVLEGDRARVQELASHRPVTAPFDAPWMLSWLAAFAPRQAFLLCAYERGALVGLAALQRVTDTWQGRRLSILQSLTNIESYRFDFLSSEGRTDIPEHIWRALFREGQGDVISLDHIPASSPTLAVGLDVARQHGWRVVLEDSFLTPWRALSDPWDRGLSSKFKANLRNRERHLAACGDVDFSVATTDDHSRAALDTFYRLEASGWKGARGTAVGQQRDVRRLYDEMIARAGDMRILLLTVGGTPVAAQVVRVCGRIMFLLKTAYDPAYAKCAPGQLLTARALQYGVEHGMDAFDFLADNAPWKSEWATGFLPHHRVRLFAPTLAGRYAYWARYGVREQIKNVPGATRFVRWLRNRRS
jgi:CelD/BcsL family acetyltransferase involved in cellulose biosynthesis